MIGFRSDKVHAEFQKAAVALRLVIEALDDAYGGALFVFRVCAPCKFEKGVHATGLAADVELDGATEEQLTYACNAVIRRFPTKRLMAHVCTPKVNKANFPSGKRTDRPHVHVQIPFDWKADPRAFLREHGYTEGKDLPG